MPTPYTGPPYPGTPSDEWGFLAYIVDGDAYDPNSNPGGLDDDGHEENFVPALRAVAAVASEVASNAAAAAAAANQQLSWVNILSGYQYIANNSFSVSGNQLVFLLPLRSLGASSSATLPNFVSKLHVKTAVYDGTSKTIVTTNETTLPSSGVLSMWMGQDPTNAPYSPVVNGATSTVAGVAGGNPAPLAGQENHLLAGDGTFRDIAVDVQINS